MMEKPEITPQHLSAVAREAKAIVSLAFRNGPIEDVHAGKVCPTCGGNPEYSHITQDEMRSIMKAAVDRVYTYLLLKENDKAAYDALLSCGEKYTVVWDEPVLTKAIRGISDSLVK
jgi:aspartokinase